MRNYLEAKLVAGTEIFVDSLVKTMIENGMIQDNYCELSNYDIEQTEKAERKFRKKALHSEPLNESMFKFKQLARQEGLSAQEIETNTKYTF